MLGQLERALGESLGDVFGYQGLQIGDLAGGRHLLAGAGLHRRLMLDAPRAAEAADVPARRRRAPAVPAPAPGASGAGAANGEGTGGAGIAGGTAPRAAADIHADVLSLPIATGSMKAVLFFHTLDFCEHPHRALREADRVLTDDGQLIIVGFNPFSAFGARHFASGWRRREPWNGRFWSRGRVAEWLSVLDYRVLDSRAMFIRPPINSERLLRRLGALERLEPWLGAIGGLYVMRARKQTVPMTLARRQWRRQRAAVGAAGLALSGTREALPSNVARVDFRKR